MAPRSDLSVILNALAENVYFQPPSNISIKYPCVIYTRAGDDTKWAGNRRYLTKVMYEVTVIDRSPESPLWDAILNLPLCEFDRHFTADNLNHDVFTLYF